MTALDNRTAPPSTGRAARTERLAASDRPWAGAGHVGCILGPLRPTDPSAVVAAVRTLADLGPQTRLGLTRYGTRRWRYDPAAFDPQRLVTAVATVDEAEFRTTIARVMASAEPTGAAGLPLHFVVSPRWFAMINQHVVCDGHQVMRIAAAVLSVAHGGPVPAWTGDVPFDHPLRTALWRTFGRRPARVRDVLADRPRLPVAGEHRAVAWTPSPCLASARTSTDARRALVRWGAEHAAGASLAALALGALRVGLAEYGIVLDASSSVAINARRYLPRGATVAGNFAARLDVVPAHPDAPAELHAAIERATEVGRPLAALAASAAASRRPRPHVTASTAPVGAPGHLGFSYFGRPMEIERLPWDGPAEQRRIIGHVDPGGPEQLGALVFLIGGGLQFSLNFHDTYYDAARVHAAVDAIAADPVARLEARRG